MKENFKNKKEDNIKGQQALGVTPDKYRTAFLSVKEGKYTVTLRVAKVKDKKAVATFQLTEKEKNYSQIFMANSYTYAQRYVSNFVPSSSADYIELDIADDGTFQIEFNLEDYKDMVFGKVVKVLA